MDCFIGARELAQSIAAREISAHEVMVAFLRQTERMNPSVGAICTQIPEEQALALARKADEELAAGAAPGPLHGLPMAVKDLAATRGLRTTFGSRVFADHVPEHDALFVERLKAAGALIIGKTNTPEFGAGSHTFNELFGVTRNPYDLSKSAGGSSGGAAAALACGMVPLADGSDMGGSLRNPASFCNVVGFRPSVGRVPTWPALMAWQSRFGVEGPMARSVADCALLLSVMAGPDPRDPLSLAGAPEVFREPLQSDPAGVRIAWSSDLGTLPVARAVVRECERALQTFQELGCVVQEAHPDLHDAMEIFRVLRAGYFAQFAKPFWPDKRELVKRTARENIELGLQLSGADFCDADAKRTALHYRALQFFEKHDFLALPAAQVLPFDVEAEWVREIEGQPMSDYIEWMTICCAITVMGAPAISVPCGFSPEGLPIGLQLVGKPGHDHALLRLAHAFEQATGHARVRPPGVAAAA